MVEICLVGEQTSVSLLLIPDEDVTRLAIRPLKWLRFVTFSVCGARGNLLQTPDGPVVDYESTTLPANATYYYLPNVSAKLAFIDSAGLDEKVTSTAKTLRSSNFRARIMQRDGEYCVATHDGKEACDAVHIIPLKKGNEYLQAVVQNRSHSYDETTTIYEINGVENGIFLRTDLHRKLANGLIAFLKAPNFALVTNDIQIAQRNPVSANGIILHRLKHEPLSDDVYILAPDSDVVPPKPHVQVVFRGTGHPQPPAVILDFMYGVAAYNNWKSQATHLAIEETRKRYASLLQEADRSRQHDIDDGMSQGEEADDPGDPDYHPSSQESLDDREDTLVKAMDDMMFLSWYLNGISPEEVVKRMVKREEEEERLAQEASRCKVAGWISNSTV